MTKRIYVGNLSYQTTENDLSALFEQCGQVESVNIITDRDTGRSKGFAFVEMANDDAEKARVRSAAVAVDAAATAEAAVAVAAAEAAAADAAATAEAVTNEPCGKAATAT